MPSRSASHLVRAQCFRCAAEADVRPLRGVRFDPDHAGPVGPLIAPPYDVVANARERAEFGIGGIENVNVGVAGNQHAHAARRYREWRHQGVLRRDAAPAIYLHQHQFAVNGVSHRRTSLIARVRLADWEERIVLPHERTTPGPRAERLARLRAVNANLSPLYFLFRDADDAVRNLVTSYVDEAVPPTDRDRMGGTHRLLTIESPEFHGRMAELFASRTLFVADGHHRYEAALTFRNERRSRDGYDRDAPTEFVLAMLAAVEDPGVLVRPTHRLLDDGSSQSPAAMLELLRRWFDVRPAVGRAPVTNQVGFISRVVLPGEAGVWDLYALPGNPHEALFPPDRGRAWRSLGVSAVQGVLESLLGAGDRGVDERVVYAIDEATAITRVEQGEARAAFLLPPPELDRLLAVAEEGDLLPAKSSWFEPKAPAGLVISELTP
jgi:uncharacterized protein (DUF1015 family)